MIIAIDGPAASGKGALGRRLAERFDLAYLDTGLLYRAVGAELLARGQDPGDEHAAIEAAEALTSDKLETLALRGTEVAQAASKVSAIPGVRQALLTFQRRFAENPPGGKEGAVLDGRDIGTIVYPGADAKLFVDADITERARRRHSELANYDPEITYNGVLADLEARDKRDRERTVAPLAKAPDAFFLDTSTLDTDQAFNAALNLVQRAADTG